MLLGISVLLVQHGLLTTQTIVMSLSTALKTPLQLQHAQLVLISPILYKTGALSVLLASTAQPL